MKAILCQPYSLEYIAQELYKFCTMTSEMLSVAKQLLLHTTDHSIVYINKTISL